MSVTRRPEYSLQFQTSGVQCAIDFGFEARRVQLHYSSGPVYLTFQSTAPSTDGFVASTAIGYIIVDDGPAMGGLTLYATSTGITFNLLALGG